MPSSRESSETSKAADCAADFCLKLLSIERGHLRYPACTPLRLRYGKWAQGVDVPSPLTTGEAYGTIGGSAIKTTPSQAAAEGSLRRFRWHWAAATGFAVLFVVCAVWSFWLG